MAIFSNTHNREVRYDHYFEKPAADACAKLSGQTVTRASLSASQPYEQIGGMTDASQKIADEAVRGAILLGNAIETQSAAEWIASHGAYAGYAWIAEYTDYTP